MNGLSLRPGPWINHTSIQVIILLFDYKYFSLQLTLFFGPKPVCTIRNKIFQNMYTNKKAILC